MKRLTVAPLAFIVLLGMGCRKFSASYTDSEKLSVAIPTGGTLRVFTPHGEIRVRSGDVHEAQITAQKVVRSRTAEEARRFCEETKITTETQPDRLSVSVELPGDHRGRAKIAVGLPVTVPANCNLDLKTHDGDIVAGGIKGNVEMRTSRGNIVAEDIAGNVVADTSNGSVQLERVGASVQAFAFKGHITCEIFGDTSATVYGRVIGGRITTDFPLTIKEGRLFGKIGDGEAATIDLRTMNGDITLRRVNERDTGNGGPDDN